MKLLGDKLENKMKSSQGSASVLVTGSDRSAREEIPPLCVFFDAGCGMLAGPFSLSVFYFSFFLLPYSIFMCIYCVISIHIRFSPVYV